MRLLRYQLPFFVLFIIAIAAISFVTAGLYTVSAQDSPAQPGTPSSQGEEGQSNVAFILDASGSMQATLPDGERRITAARRALGQLASEIPTSVNASLWVFGHRIGNSEAERARSCQDIEQLIPLGSTNVTQFQAAASSVTARGWTPLTDVISQAASTLPPASDNSIVLISDGEATCGGDPCALARRLHDSNIELVVNTIGFDVDATTREQLQCIARVTEGQYFDASSADELGNALQQAAVQPTAIPPTVVPATLTPVPTIPPQAMFRAVNSAGEVQQDVRFVLDDFRTTNYTGNGTVSLPPGQYSGGLYVPLPQGNEQFLSRVLWPGEGEIGPGETIDINIDDYFGDLVTLQAADAEGNLLPNARVDILSQFCRGDIRATFTGQAQWQRNTFNSNRICLRVTVDGDVFQPGPDTLNSPSAANLSIARDVRGNTATITAFDEVVLFSDRATPPQVGVAQIVDADGNRLEGRGSRFFAGGNDGTKLSWRPGGDLGFTRVYLETGTFNFSRQGEPEFLGTYDILPGEELQIVYETGQRFGTAPAADSLADIDVIFFDDFEQEDIGDLVRNYVRWANWTVVSGTVDAINGARIRNADASYGVMVDLDGSTRESGIFTTTRQFTLEPDDYTLSFDAASSRLGQDNTFRVTIGDALDETITISTEEPIATYSYTFTVSQPTTVGITFDHTLTPGDDNGAYIDNVRLTTAGTSTVTATLPPATTATPTAFPTPIQTPGTPPPAGTGELLTFGLPIEGTLTSGETDLWTFVGSEGQPIDIIVDGSNLSGSGDTLMTLVSPDGSLLLTIDDNDMAGTLRLNPGLDDYVLPASGNYTLQVRALDPSTTGPYTLSIRTD